MLLGILVVIVIRTRGGHGTAAPERKKENSFCSCCSPAVDQLSIKNPKLNPEGDEEEVGVSGYCAE